MSIVDERGEFGGFSPGVNTDVLTGFGKKKGIEIAVRTLSPELIVCDEIADDARWTPLRPGSPPGWLLLYPYIFGMRRTWCTSPLSKSCI